MQLSYHWFQESWLWLTLIFLFSVPDPSNHRYSWLQGTSTHHNAISSNGRRPITPHSVFPTSPAAISSVEDLFDFICAGPLIKQLGLAPNTVSESIDKWLQCGLYLCRLFKLNELNLTIPQKVRIYHYYLPVFFWCEDQISLHKSKVKDGDEIPPTVVCLFPFNFLF